MADDQSSIDPRPKSWIDKIAQVFSDEPTDTKSLLELLRNAEQDQVLDADALSIIEGALQVSSMQVREIMIPRPQVLTVTEKHTLEEALDTVVKASHSRFPVLAENSDSIVGILLAKDLLPYALSKANDTFNVSDIMRQAMFVPESKRLNILLKEFRENRQHMAIVIDEYGSPCGVVTIEDILEQIVGEIDDEFDVDDETAIKKIDASNYIVKALTPIADFNDYFACAFSDSEVDTIGGLIIQHLSHIPERDESIIIGEYKFTVLNADSRQIRLLRASRVATEVANPLSSKSSNDNK